MCQPWRAVISGENGRRPNLQAVDEMQRSRLREAWINFRVEITIQFLSHISVSLRACIGQQAKQTQVILQIISRRCNLFFFSFFDSFSKRSAWRSPRNVFSIMVNDAVSHRWKEITSVKPTWEGAAENSAIYSGNGRKVAQKERSPGCVSGCLQAVTSL